MTTGSRLVLLVAVLGCALGVGACGAASPAGRASVCLPSPLSIDPARVKAGAAVTVSSPPFACRGSYPAGHRYTLVLGQVGRAAPIDLGRFAVSREVAFRAVVHIPRRASPGQSYVVVSGSPCDHCAGTKGGAASCAGYDASVRVLPST